MTTDSSKACLELILMLSLPREAGSTTFVESGNMKNLSPLTNRARQQGIDEAPAMKWMTNRRKGSLLSLPPKSNN